MVNCSFAECENLNKFGRFSYNKFNKEIEVCFHRDTIVFRVAGQLIGEYSSSYIILYIPANLEVKSWTIYGFGINIIIIAIMIAID